MTRTTTAFGEALSPDTLASGRLRRLFAIWLERRGGRRWPRRADIRPEDIAFMLGTVNLVEVLRAPLRFRLRLVGSGIEDLGRRGDQGKMIDEIDPPDYAKLVHRHYAEVVESGEPGFHRITFTPLARPTRHPLSYERVALPLSADGAEIDMLLAASDWPKEISPDLRHYHHEA